MTLVKVLNLDKGRGSRVRINNLKRLLADYPGHEFLYTFVLEQNYKQKINHMEENKIPQRFLDNIVISLYFTIAYAALLIVYLGLPIRVNSDFLLILFIVCSLVFSIGAIYFAAKSYQKTKISSIILIVINSLGLLVPLTLLLLLI